MRRLKRPRKRTTWQESWAPSVAACIDAGRQAGLEGAKLVRFCCRAGPTQTAIGYWPRRAWVREVKRQLGVRRQRRAAAEHYPLFDRGDP